MINVNRHGKKRECQPSDFDLLPGFFLEIGNHLGPIAIHVNESGHNENKRDRNYRGDANHDQNRFAAHSHRDIPNTIACFTSQSFCGMPTLLRAG
jgi:hypothetical protein